MKIFKCDFCQGIFKCDLSEEAKEAEFRKDFPGFPVPKPEDMCSLCDECYEVVMEKVRRDGFIKKIAESN